MPLSFPALERTSRFVKGPSLSNFTSRSVGKTVKWTLWATGIPTKPVWALHLHPAPDLWNCVDRARTCETMFHFKWDHINSVWMPRIMHFHLCFYEALKSDDFNLFFMPMKVTGAVGPSAWWNSDVQAARGSRWWPGLDVSPWTETCLQSSH